jgi:hypothetical protein
MKKWIVAIIIALALGTGIAAIYIFIPNKLAIANVMVLQGTLNSVSRVIADSSKWKPWWPDSSQNTLTYQGYSYRVAKRLYNAAEVIIHHGTDSVKSTITLLPINKDSILLEWRLDLSTGSTPWEKLRSNRKAANLKASMQDLLAHLKTYVEKTENIYGIQVTKTRVKDTLLIVTKSNFLYPPTIEETYKLINILKSHAMAEGVPQTGSPMLHVLPVNPGYEMMVALPVGRAPKENEKVSIRRMVPGNILVTEVSGGPYTIQHAFRQLENYVWDHRYESPAKPFQSLVTKRDLETDTAKWVTRIYYPIF